MQRSANASPGAKPLALRAAQADHSADEQSEVFSELIFDVTSSSIGYKAKRRPKGPPTWGIVAVVTAVTAILIGIGVLVSSSEEEKKQVARTNEAQASWDQIARPEVKPLSQPNSPQPKDGQRAGEDGHFTAAPQSGSVEAEPPKATPFKSELPPEPSVSIQKPAPTPEVKPKTKPQTEQSNDTKSNPKDCGYRWVDRREWRGSARWRAKARNADVADDQQVEKKGSSD